MRSPFPPQLREHLARTWNQIETASAQGVQLSTLLYLLVTSSGLAVLVQHAQVIRARTQPAPTGDPPRDTTVAPTVVSLSMAVPPLPPTETTNAVSRPSLPSPVTILNLSGDERRLLAQVAGRRWDGRRWYLGKSGELLDYLPPQARDRHQEIAANSGNYPHKADYEQLKYAEYLQFLETRPRIRRLIVGSSIALSIPEEFLGTNDFNLGVPAYRLEESRQQVAGLSGDRPPESIVVFGAATPELLNETPPKDILRDAIALVDDLRSKYPETPVTFVSVLPRSRDSELVDPRMGDVNNQVVGYLNRALSKSFAADPQIRFLDLDPYITDDEGYLKRAFSTDGLHPNALGALVLMKLLNVVDGG